MLVPCWLVLLEEEEEEEEDEEDEVLLRRVIFRSSTRMVHPSAAKNAFMPSGTLMMLSRAMRTGDWKSKAPSPSLKV